MTELAVVVLQIDSLPGMSETSGDCPVIRYQPEIQGSWQETLRQIERSGAQRVVLQYSNETIAIPPHDWRYLDWHFRRYRRLFSANEFVAFSSPWSCLELLPDISLPLPDLRIECREPAWDAAPDYWTVRMLYAFEREQWETAEQLLAAANGSIAEADIRFASACLYSRTNRRLEAFEAGSRALSAEACDDRPPQCDPSRLWLAYGLFAAHAGKREIAGTAFRMSDAEKRNIEPLVCLLDESIREGDTEDEAIAAVEQWLDREPAELDRLAQVLHGAGLYERALAIVGDEEAPSAAITARIRFDGLIHAGRLAEAIVLHEEQPDEYRQRFPADDWLCRLLLADDERNELAAAMEPALVDAVLERAVSLRLAELAERLSPYAGPSAEPLAGKWFRHGFVMRSAAGDLASLRAGTLDIEGFRRLGYTLYFRGAYEQAAGMLEYVLAHAPEDASLRTALSLAYLRHSEALLGESMHIFPSSLFLREEADKVHASVKRLERSGALPQWRRAERRNFHA